MAQADQISDHLSDYERAVCYYTLPRVDPPPSQASIVGYALALLASFALMVAAVLAESNRWLYISSGAMGMSVLYGLTVFPARALASSIRRRRVLQAASNVPDAQNDESAPDPFAHHVLLRHPMYRPGALYALTDKNADIDYFVDFGPDGRCWKVKTAQDEEWCRVQVLEGMPSFLLSLGAGYPARVGVYRGEDRLALIERQFSIRDPRIEIRLEMGDKKTFVVRQQGIYEGPRLVGRVYALRQAYYLDIERTALNEGTVAYFVSTL
ncbi:MAG: hypothetical protein IT368_10645 [Candidatus Hydrogenedentes bacterium]|nr:hypothetical protein [Candidatus Hydrogenedentota bacterium]